MEQKLVEERLGAWGMRTGAQHIASRNASRVTGGVGLLYEGCREGRGYIRAEERCARTRAMPATSSITPCG